MFKILKQSWLWYVVYSIIVFLKFKIEGKFILQMAPDSASYLNADLSSIVTALSGVRTLGYPLFLKGISLLSPDFLLLPEIQFIVYAIAVFIFFIGLRIYGFSGGQALITSCPLLFVEIIREYAAWMLTESLTVSLAILTIGLLLMVVSKPRNMFYCLGLSVSLFITYQVRPAFLFLILLTPFMGLILLLLRNKPCKEKKIYRSISVKLLAISIIPFLAFSTLRLATVNHFGLVSFGGYNIVGLATSMLTDDLIPDLPSAQQPLAKAIVEKRRLHRESMKTDEGVEINPGGGIVPKYCTQSLPPPNSINYQMWVECYNYNIWQLSVPVATEIYSQGKETILNDNLSKLSIAIIKNRPFLYFIWLSNAFKITIYGLTKWEKVAVELAKLLIIYTMLRLSLSLSRFFRIERFISRCNLSASHALLGVLVIAATMASIRLLLVSMPESFVLDFGNFTFILLFFSAILSIKINFWFSNNIGNNFAIKLAYELAAIVIIGMTFFLSGMVLVILVEPPDNRYVNAVSMFLPSTLSLTIFMSVSSLYHQLRRLGRFSPSKGKN